MLSRLLELQPGLAIYGGHPEDVQEQDVNAQVMPPEMFERLTETIKRDGRLEQLPFAVLRKARTDGRDILELISGHHRIRAARTAAVTDLYFLVDETDLSRSEVVAKQLAHNKIHGESDPQVVKRLFDEIKTVDAQLESYIRPEDFDGIKQLSAAALPEVRVALEYRRVSFTFLPGDMERLDILLEAAKTLPARTDLVGVVDIAIFERFRKLALELGKAKDVRSLGALVAMMLDITEAHLEQIREPAAAE